jgi:hypothetical protein
MTSSAEEDAQQQPCIHVAATIASSCELHMQVSSRESKDGNEAKLEACKTFSRVVAAGLHRVATAMAKDSECISKASKVSQWVKDDFCMICFAAHPIYAVIPVHGLMNALNVNPFIQCSVASMSNPTAYSCLSHAFCTLLQMKFSCTLLRNHHEHEASSSAGLGLVAAPPDTGQVSVETSAAVADQDES